MQVFFFFFLKSNLSVLESKECRLKNQTACRQTNTLKTSRAQRQPNYAKPGGWFISAHLQSLRVLPSLLVRLCTPLQTAGLSGRELQPVSLFGTTVSKEPFAPDCTCVFGAYRLQRFRLPERIKWLSEITGGADHEKEKKKKKRDLSLMFHIIS